MMASPQRLDAVAARTATAANPTVMRHRGITPVCPASRAKWPPRKRAIDRPGRLISRGDTEVALDPYPRLELEEEALARQASAEADQLAAGSDHPVARYEQRHRVPVARDAHRPRGGRIADVGGDFSVGTHLG